MQARRSGLTHNGPMNALHGIRILDLSRVLAGPWCTQTLADLGADVVKVERPSSDRHPGGDDTRGWGPPFLRGRDGADTAEAAYFLGANRNKRSITCDIARPEGQALIRSLAAQAQVFVENYKVGDMARYGLDWPSLQKINPRLVYCSITGFGQTGPYQDRAGYDYAVQGLGGLMSVTGERDDRPGGGPQKVGVAVADLFTGLYATVAIQAALRHAERTGEGQQIDMALLDTQVAMLANLGANYLVRGREDGTVPGRAGNAHVNIVPYQVFEVAPDALGQAQIQGKKRGLRRRHIQRRERVALPEGPHDERAGAGQFTVEAASQGARIGGLGHRQQIASESAIDTVRRGGPVSQASRTATVPGRARATSGFSMARVSSAPME